MIPSDDPRLLPIALRKDLLARGYPERALALGLRSGALYRPRRGAYVDGPAWRRLTPEQKYAVRARAVYLQRKTDLWISHVGALALTDAPLWGFALADVDVTRDDGRCGRREAGVRQHGGRLREDDVVEEHGTRVSTPLRAALEAPTVGSLESALAVVNHYLHRGDFTLEQLSLRYDAEMDRWPFSLRTRMMLRLAEPKVESVGESRMSYFLWRAGIRVPEVQHEVYDGEELVARLDFADPERRFWIEFDGKVKYLRPLRPGENASQVVVREKAREDRVRELTGWSCFRVVWADLEDPAALERRLRRFIDNVASAARATA